MTASDYDTFLNNLTAKDIPMITAAFTTLQTMCDPAVFQTNEPFLLNALPHVLQTLKGKDRDMVALAQTIVKHICTRSSPHTVGALVLAPYIFGSFSYPCNAYAGIGHP